MNKITQNTTTNTEATIEPEMNINEHKSQLNNLIIENSSYRRQIKFFREEVNKYKKILSLMIDNSEKENKLKITDFLELNNKELEEVINQNEQIIEDSNKEYNILCIDFEQKFGESGVNNEISAFEDELFLLNNIFEAKEREILHLESFYQNIKKPKSGLAFEYYDIDKNIINQTLNINLNELRGSYASLSKQIINMKSKNESSLNMIKVN